MQVRLGLIGCGIVTRYCHVPALGRIRHAKIVALADPDDRARKAIRDLVQSSEHARVDDVLARDDVDAVVIAAPTGLHAELALAAAAARKHFYLEKPIATTVDDARSVARAGARAGVTAVVGFNRRAHPLHEQAREIIADGQLGRIRAIQTVFCEPVSRDAMPSWKQTRATGGGVLLDLGSHHIDLVRWLLDDEVRHAHATLTSDASEHDSAQVHLTMAGGAEVQSVFSFRAALADFLEVIGDRGTLRLDRHRASLTRTTPRHRGYGLRSRAVPPTPSVARWWLRRVMHPGEDPSYERALRRFVDGIRGAPRGLATLQDGLRNLEVIAAAEASAGVCNAGPVLMS